MFLAHACLEELIHQGISFGSRFEVIFKAKVLHWVKRRSVFWRVMLMSNSSAQSADDYWCLRFCERGVPLF